MGISYKRMLRMNKKKYAFMHKSFEYTSERFACLRTITLTNIHAVLDRLDTIHEYGHVQFSLFRSSCILCVLK